LPIIECMDEATFRSLLEKGVQSHASDVLLKVGQPPAFRIRGALHYLQGAPLRPEHTRAMAELVLRGTRYRRPLDDLQEFDTSYEVAQSGRYRVNVYRQRGTLAIALRFVPFKIPSFEELRLPPVVQSLATLERG